MSTDVTDDNVRPADASYPRSTCLSVVNNKTENLALEVLVGGGRASSSVTSVVISVISDNAVCASLF
jgi:hypothetical protein